MSSTILLVLVRLVILSLALPPNKLLTEGCIRPRAFKNQEVLAEYINCVKSIASDQRYGKRSLSNPSILIKHLHPRLHVDYDLQQPNPYLHNMFEQLKYDDK